MKPRPLYTSIEVHEEIAGVLADPSPRERRVVVAAYIGPRAATYLPAPEGLRIVCAPTPGFTSGNAVREIKRRGAIVQFSDWLHAKVYWSDLRGCVVCSANVSVNALARKGLQESGVWMPRGHFDIERLLRAVEPRAVTRADLERLDQAPIRHPEGNDHRVISKEVFDYPRWYSSSHRRAWRLGWWEDESLRPAIKAVEKSRIDFDSAKPHDYMNVREGEAAARSWLLCFKVDGKRVTRLSWLFVNFVLRVPSSDRHAFEKDYPLQAVQVRPHRENPEPPFELTAAFRTAFADAVGQFGIERMQRLPEAKPPKNLLEHVYRLCPRGAAQ